MLITHEVVKQFDVAASGPAAFRCFSQVSASTIMSIFTFSTSADFDEDILNFTWKYFDIVVQTFSLLFHELI